MLKERELATDIAARLRQKKALIGVLGLGYVGLPICLAAAEAEIRVLGFDTDPEKTATINEGRSYFNHIDGKRIRRQVSRGMFSASSDFSRLSEPDALLICVPTPITRHLEPDLSFVVATGEKIARRLRRGQLVVLESTTYPGTTREVLRPILESSGLVCGRDFFLAFSPEREDPGNTEYSTSRIPKVIGADSAQEREVAIALYEAFLPRTVPVTSSATAEAVKLTENIFRAVNIALVNELKVIYGALGVDIWEVIEAAKTKPFGFMPFYPGPGLGGHCIPIDPFYLSWKAREYGIIARFIELAGEINSAMPKRVISTLAEALDRKKGKGLNGSRILLAGVAYKKNIEDIRESPALELMEILEARGAAIDYYDPFVSIIPETREHKSLAGRRSLAWPIIGLSSYDAVLIVTDHDCVDYAEFVKRASLIVDTRNACRHAGAFANSIVLA